MDVMARQEEEDRNRKIATSQQQQQAPQLFGNEWLTHLSAPHPPSSWQRGEWNGKVEEVSLMQKKVKMKKMTGTFYQKLIAHEHAVRKLEGLEGEDAHERAHDYSKMVRRKGTA